MIATAFWASFRACSSRFLQSLEHPGARLGGVLDICAGHDQLLGVLDHGAPVHGAFVVARVHDDHPVVLRGDPVDGFDFVAGYFVAAVNGLV